MPLFNIRIFVKEKKMGSILERIKEISEIKVDMKTVVVIVAFTVIIMSPKTVYVYNNSQ